MSSAVLLVVHLELAGTTENLAVEGVLDAILDLDDDGLVHLVADHEALTRLALGPRLRGVVSLAHAVLSSRMRSRPSLRSVHSLMLSSPRLARPRAPAHAHA